MIRSNVLWGFGGLLFGAITTYFVMEHIHEKELADIYGEPEVEVCSEDEDDVSSDERKVLDITDAEMYRPHRSETIDPHIHVVTSEEHQDEEEGLLLESIRAHEEANNDPDLDPFVPEDDEDTKEEEEGEDVNAVNAYNGIHLIEVAEVHPGRRIVAQFNHTDCTLDISSVMSVKTDLFDEVVDERLLEELIGGEAFSIIMNADPTDEQRMLGVRNNVINLDFAISY